MDLLWKRGGATAAELTQVLGHRLTNASVRTVLRRIEQKGFVTHRTDGRTFVYEPRVDPDTVARGALRRLLDRFYGGSAQQLIVGMIDGELLGRTELRTLARQIETMNAGARPQRRRR